MQAWDQFQKSLHKTHYYLSGYWERLIPRAWWRARIERRYAAFLTRQDAWARDLRERADYLFKRRESFPRNPALSTRHQLYEGKKSAAYDIDLYRILRMFPAGVNVSYWFGDIVDIPDYPTFVKSRPIYADARNQNSVLLKFNKIRHYYVVKDVKSFSSKRPQLVWRGKSNQQERVEVLAKFFDSPLCNVGDTHSKPKRPEFVRPFMSIPEQLDYRYILSVEGNDVATNTKWIMASNSLCFMRKPRFETWFREGSLIPNYHYVLLEDDYSDVEEKIAFYNANPDAAEAIVKQANEYVAQFFNEADETLLTYIVVRRYLELSGQMAPL